MFGIRPRGDEERVLSPAWGEWQGEGGTPTYSGAKVNVPTATQLLAVYGCNRFICDGIATLPIDVFRKQGDIRVPSSRPRWLDQPTPDLDTISWLTQIITSLLLDGNFYGRLHRSQSNPLEIDEITPLDPMSVGVRREKGRKQFIVGGRAVDGFEMLHIPGVMLPGADVGMSVVEAARQTIGKGMAIDQFSGMFFSQGGTYGGVIEDPGPLDPTKARETARMWARLHSGTRNSHLPGVLQGGATWKATGVTPEQAQFLQTHQFNEADICAFMFQIDPTEMGVSLDKGSSVTYANMEQRNSRKVSVTYMPWMVRIERVLSSLLQSSRYIKFNVSGLLRADSTARWTNYETASRINAAAQATGDAPVMLTKEMRALEDWEPIPEADIPTAPPVAAPVVPAQQNNLRLIGEESA